MSHPANYNRVATDDIARKTLSLSLLQHEGTDCSFALHESQNTLLTKYDMGETSAINRCCFKTERSTDTHINDFVS